MRTLALVFAVAAVSACSPSDDDQKNATGGTGGIAGSGGSGGTGGDGGTGGTGGDGGTGGTGGDGGTGGTGGDGGTGGTGGTGGDPGSGGTGGNPGTGGTGGDGGTGGTGGIDDPDPLVVRVAIDPPSLNLVELDRLVLKATAYDADDEEVTGLPVAWQSSNQAVVRVTADGSVFAAGAGVATISATIENVKGQAEVTVTAGEVVGVSVEDPASPVTMGDSVLLSARVTDAQDRVLQGRTIAWSSSDPLVATVDDEGVVTGLLPGTVTITAEVDGVQGQVDVDVVRAAGSGSHRVATGVYHTCYLDDEGAAWCWGVNWYGQLGDGTFDDHAIPAPVETDLAFVSIAAGDFWTCALTEAGELYCWGGDSFEFLGGEGGSAVPVLVTSDPYAFIAGMNATGCLLDPIGHAYCWGSNSVDHEFGNATTEPSSVPQPVDAPFEGGQPLVFKDLKGGMYHACALTIDSRLFCWGYNIANQLGQGWTDSVDRPVEVLGGEPVTAFGTSHFGSCATAGGTSYCWGENEFGQTGNGTSGETVAAPAAIHSGGVAFVEFAGGRDFMCALDPFAHAWCWGSNDSFKLGYDGGDSNVPVPVSGGLQFESIFARDNHACGLAYSGGLYCWGDNSWGQLGIGAEFDFADTPTLVQW